MGKIRVKTFGDEEQEKKDQKKTQARAEAKKVEAAKKQAGSSEKSANVIASNSEAIPNEIATSPTAPRNDEKETPKKEKKAKFAKEKKQNHSVAYLAVAKHLDASKKYKLAEALALLPQLQRANFDETVELHMNTTDKGISGAVVLPHGTGKTIRVAIADAATDLKAVEDLVKKIEAGQIDFDVLIATPDSMPKLARVARVLGPRGLMPNPKNGTVTPKPADAAKKFEGGQMNFKTEAKFPVLHMSVGKVSFGEKKLADNIKAALVAVNAKNIKDVTLKSTMSPGLKLDIASL